MILFVSTVLLVAHTGITPMFKGINLIFSNLRRQEKQVGLVALDVYL